MSKSKTNHPTQGAVPEIDREAETLEPLMPTSENEPPSRFAPKSGINTPDMLEISLMYLLQLSGNPAQFEPGALRNLALPAERVAMLSASAQRHMQQLAPPPAAEGVDENATLN